MQASSAATCFSWNKCCGCHEMRNPQTVAEVSFADLMDALAGHKHSVLCSFIVYSPGDATCIS